jgi:membrane associated rhomboid family serine protease
VIPIQDVVPTGRAPAATLIIIALNVIVFAAGFAGPPALAPFAHLSVISLGLSLLFLWLFGDNVEAHLGRGVLVALYLIGGWVSGVGAAGAVTAIIGSYVVILPQSRMLMLVPLPAVLVEVPAIALIAAWAMLNALQFVRHPQTLWTLALAFAFGAAVAWLMRPRVRW